eukprot:4637247-Pyramimonas_sp.AAC.1
MPREIEECASPFVSPFPSVHSCWAVANGKHPPTPPSHRSRSAHHRSSEDVLWEISGVLLEAS